CHNSSPSLSPYLPPSITPLWFPVSDPKPPTRWTHKCCTTNVMKVNSHHDSSAVLTVIKKKKKKRYSKISLKSLLG
ncbi:unnamed protein product, partial [Musa acuminata var. zebrina]